MPRPIFLMSDFGASGYYQGVMKAVIAGISPETRIFNLTHGVKAGNIEEAGFVLRAALDYLPRDAVLVIVVDPGVGTERRILACRFGDRQVLVPDNRILAGVLDREDFAGAWSVTNEELFLESPAATFAGRDIFAPVAAQLSQGFDLEQLGPTVTDVLGRDTSQEQRKPLLDAAIVHVDPFGNLITSVNRDEWVRRVGTPSFVIEVGTARIERLSRTYEDGRPGEALAYIGSTGQLEVALRGGNASQTHDLTTGDHILVFKR